MEQRQQQPRSTETTTHAAMPSLTEIAEATADRLASAVAPRNLDDVERLAKRAADARLFGCTSVADAFVRIVTGAEVGVSPYTSLRAIRVYNGIPSMEATLIRGLVLRAKDCEYFELVGEPTAASCTMASKRRGRPEARTTWTIEDAKTAGLLTKDAWKHYPKDLLVARCTTAHVKRHWADVFSGLVPQEELEPIPVGEQPTLTESEVADSLGNSAYRDLLLSLDAQLKAAQNSTDLKAFATAARAAALDKSDREALKGAFSARQAEIKAAAKAAQAAELATHAPLPPVGNGVDDFGPEPADDLTPEREPEQHDPQTGELPMREPGEEG